MKLTHAFLAIALIAVLVVTLAGARGHHFTSPPFEVFPDMVYQDKVKDQVPSKFFGDGNSAREPIPGTVAMEMPAVSDYWSSGKWDATHWGTGIPTHDATTGAALAIDAQNMARGRERFNISCEVCHGEVGDGKGITSKYGLNGAADFHSQRLIDMTDGEIFNTISNGKGQMLGYGYNIAIDDRWRIVMYIRALQRSQTATLEDASPEEQQKLNDAKKPAAPPAPAPDAAAPKSALFNLRPINTTINVVEGQIHVTGHLILQPTEQLDKAKKPAAPLPAHASNVLSSFNLKLAIDRDILGDWTPRNISDASDVVISKTK